MQRGRSGLLTANGSAELTRGDDLFRLNAGASRNNSRPYERVGRFAPTGAFRGELATAERAITDKLEVGADYTHLFRPGLTGQVLALQTLGRVDGETASTQPGTAQLSTNTETSGESIVRATVSWQPRAVLSIEAGGEGAFNFLEGRTAVSTNGVAVVLPNASLRVEERRAEGLATAVWKPSDRLSVEASVRAEVSKITSQGDTARSRSFFYGKPRLVIAYAPDAASQVRLRLQRQVGQLRFRDFVASAELTTGTLDAGNAELEPERSWIAEVALERRFWGKGAVVATFTHEAVQQVVDLIPIAGRDAPGNIGDGRRDRINLALTVPLDRLGIAGGLITGQGNWKWSEVTDPVTGETRRISGEAPTGGRISFTQDVARLSSTWGLELLVGEGAVTYRINEIRRQSEDGGLHFFWDWKPDRTLSVRAELRNVLSRERRRTRTRYSGSRALGLVNEVEWEAHAFEPYAYVRIRKVL
jgi:outer membrane receptor protein involved in Fe transport